MEKGRVKILVTKNTVDEAYRWTAQRKETKMYEALAELKNRLHLKQEKQPTLSSYDKPDVKIFADTREQSSGIIKELVDRGVDVTTQRLITADFLLSGNVGVERKAVGDFVASLIDKRILQQLKELKNNFEKPLLIIEGTEDIYSIRKIHPNAIRGMMAAIAISFQIPILYTKNVIDTAELLIAIAKREQSDGKSDFSIRGERKPLTTKEQQEYIVTSFPNIGPNVAKSLLKSFGSIKNIVNAEAEHLQKVDQIGKKKAEEIRRLIEEIYPED